MFGLGMPEILLILAIALIVIGPKKLPDLAKTLGRAMGEFKRSAQDFKNSIDIDTTIKDIEDIDPPKSKLKDALKEANEEASKTDSTGTYIASDTKEKDKNMPSSNPTPEKQEIKSDDDTGTETNEFVTPEKDK